jgi:hypothetical protein
MGIPDTTQKHFISIRQIRNDKIKSTLMFSNLPKNFLWHSKYLEIEIQGKSQ